MEQEDVLWIVIDVNDEGMLGLVADGLELDELGDVGILGILG